MSGKKVLVLVVVAALIVAGFAYYEWMKVEALNSCEVELVGVNVESIGTTAVVLELNWSIYNPNSVTATMDNATYTIFANNITLGNGVAPGIAVPPGENSTLVTDLEVAYEDAFEAIWSALEAGNVTWRLNGTAYFNTPLGALDVPFDRTLYP
ncbi:MAG: LEA type 2 family protein [Candidatus Methanosuratus sp.]|nr:LEA type 2 family protein [Candidatus Methanosuratincola sp.]